MSKEVRLSNGNFALVDDEDYPVLSRLTWYQDKNGYVGHDFRHNRSAFVKMHELLIKVEAMHEIQYIDRNPLNLQKSNLASVTRSRNVVMSRKTNRKHTTSIYRGVHWSKSLNFWVSRAKKDNKTVHCKYFHTEKEAAISYLEAIKEHHGLDLTLEQITRQEQP